MENQCKIDAKTRLEKGMRIWSKSEPKGSQNGAQNASKIPTRSHRGAKGAPKGVKCRKKGMPKMMPKFDAEKKFKSIPKWATKVPKVGPRGVRRASLRRRRFAIWLLLSETPDTGRCRRIVVRGDRRHLEILAVEAIIFIHETGGHW